MLSSSLSSASDIDQQFSFMNSEKFQRIHATF